MGEQGGGVTEIVRRKLAEGNVPDQVADLILGSMRGGVGPADAATHSPDVAGTADTPADSTDTAGGPGRAYLKSISVRGFRGIADEVTLHLPVGPGLTVVTGRNGSGKSSFAEAAEIALTGDNKRWSDRTAVWKEGWRNLHSSGPAAIEVKLTADGQSMPTVVAREWAVGAALDGAQAHVSVAGNRRPLAAKGWARPLELYRPFLSYAELGALVSGQPSKMHDAMQAILGLDALVNSERVLRDSHKSADSESKL
ncbi:MAG: AAA family ATPase [Trebonia sp.]